MTVTLVGIVGIMILAYLIPEVKKDLVSDVVWPVSGMVGAFVTGNAVEHWTKK